MPEDNKKGNGINRKAYGSIFLVLFLISTIGLAIFSTPQKAKAQWAVFDPSNWASTIWQETRDVAKEEKKSWYERLKEQLQTAADIAFKNSLRVFFGQLAEDTAVWLASAGTGQKPLFMTDPDYWNKLVDSTAGDALYSLGEEAFGVDMCDPDLEVKMNLTFALGKTYNPANWCHDSCRWVFANTNESIMERYSTPEPKEGESAIPKKGEIEYYQQYNSDSRFPEFEKNVSPGVFTCPVRCNDEKAPGMLCSKPYYELNESSWTISKTTRENLIGCINTLTYLQRTELKGSQRQLSACLKNCNLSKKSGGARKAKCSATEVFNNMDRVGSELKNQKLVGDTVSFYVQPEQNDMGQLLLLYSGIEEKTKREISREKTIWESPGIGPITSTLSTDIISPRELTEKRGTLAVDKSTSTEEIRTGSWAADVVRVFTNTLVNKLIERFFGGKCALNPGASECAGPTGGTKLSQSYFGAGGPAGIAAAKLQFSSISKVDFTRGSPGNDPVYSGNLTSEGIIDAGFQTAIDQEMTVGEALDKGLIGGVFGFDVEGQEPDVDSGIPYRSILYLRKFRVVPVGWELAAKWIQDHPQNITLEQLVGEEYDRCEGGGDKFCSNDANRTCIGNSDCYPTGDYPDCSATVPCAAAGDICHSEGDGGRNACYEQCDPALPACANPDHVCRPIAPANVTGYCVNPSEPFCESSDKVSPFCGLIDPNWVIKMPDTYCQKKGAVEEVVTRDFICDEDTNQDGEIDCDTGESEKDRDIGYWQVIRETDKCVNETSCLKEDSDGKCLKYGYCFEERPTWRFNGDECSRQYASCQTYESSDGGLVSYLNNTVEVDGCNVANAGCRWYCQDPNYDKENKTWTCTKATPDNEKIRFDRDIQTCSEAEAGCQEFITTGNGTNLVKNSSFEYYSGDVDDGIVDTFNNVTSANTCGNEAHAVTDSYAGSVSLMMKDAGCCGAADCAQYIGISVDTGYFILNRTFTASFYAKASAFASDINFRVKNGQGGGPWTTFSSETFNVGTEWQRHTFTFTVNDGDIAGGVNAPVNPNILALVINNTQSPIDMFIDAVQLEEVGPTEYKDYGAINKLYLNGDRVSCEEKNVGCEKYTPTAGGTPIPGVVYPNNLCSANKVGCQSYRETPTKYIPIRPANDPIYFVSGTGSTCDAAQVGCEEYTNLDVVAEGGEARDYFRQIRQCVKPGSAEVASFYTWEGSDTTGYQLEAYRLKKSNLSNAPCTNLSVEAAGADPVCADTAVNQGTCAAADMTTDPDCTEYYDSGANVYYMLRSRVIHETEECYPYRNTMDSQAGNDIIYYINPEGSLTCPAAYAGCREYKGNTGNVTRPVFTDDFENSEAGASNWQSGHISNESLRANEHSLRTTSGATLTSVSSPNVLLEGKIYRGQYYQVSFWLKPESATVIDLVSIVKSNNQADEPQHFINPAGPGVPVGADWNLYSFGPLVFNRDVTDQEALGIMLDGTFYIDNVVLEEVAETQYLVQNSFRTCDASEIGCQEYRDSKGNLHYISSFDHLCSEKFVGCGAMINTYNSNNPFFENIRGIDVLADVIEYVVNSESVYCPAQAKGCDRFGLPTLSQIDEPASWETKYLINDPEKYEYYSEEGDLSIACLKEEEGCDEYKYNNGTGVNWFRDPGEKTCEYKLLPDSEDYEWYRTNTNFLCPYVTPPPEGKPVGRACVKKCNGNSGSYTNTACAENVDCGRWCSGGANHGQACTDNAECGAGACLSGACDGAGSHVGLACTTPGVNTECNICNGGTSDGNVVENAADAAACAAGGGAPSQMLCDYWVGLCPDGQSGCNEYRDPSDPEPCRSSCSLEQVGTTSVPVDDNCDPTVCLGGARSGEACYTSTDCPGGNCSDIGLPGCRPYYYIRDSIEADKEKCGNLVDAEEGCLPFNDTSNPTLNMRGM